MSEARPQTLTGLIDRDYSRRPIDAIHYLLPPPSTNCCQQVSFKLHSRSILVDLSTSYTRDSGRRPVFTCYSHPLLLDFASRYKTHESFNLSTLCLALFKDLRKTRKDRIRIKTRINSLNKWN